jgi:hypothetical protein
MTAEFGQESAFELEMTENPHLPKPENVGHPAIAMMEKAG